MSTRTVRDINDNTQVVENDLTDTTMSGPHMIVEAIRDDLPRIEEQLTSRDFSGELVSQMTLLPSTVQADGTMAPASFAAFVMTAIKIVPVTPEEHAKLVAAVESQVVTIEASSLDEQATAPSSAAVN